MSAPESRDAQDELLGHAKGILMTLEEILPIVKESAVFGSTVENVEGSIQWLRRFLKKHENP